MDDCHRVFKEWAEKAEVRGDKSFAAAEAMQKLFNVFYSNIDKNWDDVHLDRLIKNMEKKKNVATSKDKVVSIVGDLNELGWEILGRPAGQIDVYLRLVQAHGQCLVLPWP